MDTFKVEPILNHKHKLNSETRSIDHNYCGRVERSGRASDATAATAARNTHAWGSRHESRIKGGAAGGGCCCCCHWLWCCSCRCGCWCSWYARRQCGAAAAATATRSASASVMRRHEFCVKGVAAGGCCCRSRGACCPCKDHQTEAHNEPRTGRPPPRAIASAWARAAEPPA